MKSRAENKDRTLPAGEAADPLYVDAPTAAAMLGITVGSLYSYVSRKGIRTRAVQGTRARLYWRDDIQKLSNRKGASDSVQDDPTSLVSETRITVLTPEGPFYRGHSAIKLAEAAHLEDVAAILWEADKRDIFPDRIPAAPENFAAIRAALSSLSPFDQAGSLLPLLESVNARAYDYSNLGYARSGGYLLRWLATLVVDGDMPSTEPFHVVLANGLNAPAGYDDIIRRALVLLADHELPPSTYAVRAVANTGCTPSQAVLAGIAAARGRRVLSGRVRAVDRLLDDVLESDRPETALIERYRDGEVLPGFADAFYSGADARALDLMTAIAKTSPDDEAVQKISRAIEFARIEYDLEVDFIIPLTFLERRLRKRQRHLTIMVIGRTVGWIAHAIEQMSSGPIVRPRTVYTGVLPFQPAQ